MTFRVRMSIPKLPRTVGDVMGTALIARLRGMQQTKDENVSYPFPNGAVVTVSVESANEALAVQETVTTITRAIVMLGLLHVYPTTISVEQISG